MRTATATSILVALSALLGMVGAIYPFGRVRDINVLTLGWNTSSPTIPREPIPPTPVSPPAPLPLPLPRLILPSRRQDGDRPADLPNIPAPGMPIHPRPGHGTQDPNDDLSPDDATPTSTQAPHIFFETSTRKSNSGVAAAEERSAAMAGLVIALGAAVALLA
ncbi:hypothetical protein M434DRAFT_15653 [Hypoxylon sp. CO27-5]|nr:hypothetical protein M434DRAFT_15653 [Hypoxylon sp. CO27-5]